MGWASGSEIACDVGTAIHKEVADPRIKKKLFAALIKSLESHDWDTKDEAAGIDPIFDKLLGFDSESQE